MSLMVDGNNKWYFFFLRDTPPLTSEKLPMFFSKRGEEKKERTKQLEQDNRQPPNALRPPHQVPSSSPVPQTPARGVPVPSTDHMQTTRKPSALADGGSRPRRTRFDSPLIHGERYKGS